MKNIENLLHEYANNKFKTELPEALQSYEEEIKKTIKPFVKLTAKSEETSLWDSKFGGKPYIPSGFEYPTNSNKQYLGLLAQLNFEDLPKFEGFPEKGILQFFVNFSEDCPNPIGLDFEDPLNQEDFRVIYHENITKDTSKLVTDFTFIPEKDLGESPINGEYKVYGEISFEAMSMYSYNFTDVLSSEIEDFIFEHNVDQLFEGSGHKIGGYPAFTQQDPREDNDFDIVLLQVDTDDSDGVDIMWGDCGVGNFFINSKDLKELNFSKVLYNWDCC